MAVHDLDAEVVVVGGGPVGMLTAAELGGYGVRVVVFEAQEAVSEAPRARVLHARALQGLVRRGYLGELLPEPGPDGCRRGGGDEAPFRFAGMPGLSIAMSGLEPGPVLKRPQAELEHLFEARARSCGVRVMRGYRVCGVVQDGGGVRVVARGASGLVACAARFVVGADGGRGSVRELLEVPSRSYRATVSGLAGVVRLADPEALPAGWHRTPRGWIVAHDIPGTGTHIRTLDCSGPHPRRREDPAPGELRAELRRITGREVPFDRPRWLSRFSDFARLARRYRVGRVFLAGDAAHLHFPVGAQGLSTGVQDALNLAWKLAFAVTSSAGEELLDTYDQERRPAAQRVIDSTRAQVALMRSGPDAEALRALFAGIVAADRESRYLSDLVSGQDTVLPARGTRPRTWEGKFLENVSLRTEAGRSDVIGLLRAGAPLLLLFGEGGARYAGRARAWSDTVRLVSAERTADIPCDALLVRPDGYVAWESASGADCLEEVLARSFGPRSAVPSGREGAVS